MAKTAMQELIEWLKENNMNHWATRDAIAKATELLEKEKHESMRSFVAGMDRVLHREDNPDFETYYQQTYNS